MIEGKINNKHGVKVKAYWWDGDDLIIDTERGQYRLEGAYIADIKFGGMEYEHTEQCTIEQNVRWSRNASSEGQQEG